MQIMTGVSTIKNNFKKTDEKCAYWLSNEIYSTFDQFPKEILDEALEDLIMSEDIVFSDSQYSLNNIFME